MVIREPIDPPDSLAPKHLAQWNELNREFAPIVISDGLGHLDAFLFPPVLQCGWWSLYATAILLMDAELQAPDLSQPDRPFQIGWDSDVTDLFWRFRQAHLDRFRSFLQRWRIATKFGFQEIGPNPASNETSLSRDECVLWFHEFRTKADVQSYAVKWTTNPNVKSPFLSQHRLVISRGIDLICSELLANAIEHSGGARGFILSKLCSPESAALSLKLDQRSPFLTPIERSIYGSCVTGNHPVLQLVISDRGHGFAGNELLRQMFKEREKRAAANEAELIEFALRPDVSTKSWLERVAALQEHANSPSGEYSPTVHGLSEVQVFIAENHGNWRIHSNDHCVDVFSDSSRAIASGARRVNGCLHYIQLPLARPAAAKAPRANRIRPISHPPAMLDLGDDMRSTTTVPMLSGTNEFVARVQRDAAPSRILILNLLALDDVEDEDLLVSASALLADGIHRAQKSTPILLIASDRTRSHLRRFPSLSDELFDRRILLYLNVFGGPDAISLDIPRALEPLRPKLLEALNPWADESVFYSSIADDQEVWNILEQVRTHNSGLLTIRKVGLSDYVFQGRIKIDADSDLGRAVLVGGRSFTAFAGLLKGSRAVLPHSPENPYWFDGHWTNSHLNLGRILTNETALADIVRWFAVAQRTIRLADRGADVGNAAAPDSKGQAAATAAEGKASADRHEQWSSQYLPGEPLLLGVLHPAIGIAQELLRRQASDLELIEVTSTGEITPESWQFVAVTGRKVIILVDMVNTGETLAHLVELVQSAGGHVIGALAILSIVGARQDVPLFSYSQCTLDQLSRLASEVESKAKTGSRWIVDGNSQFTIPLAYVERPLSVRTRKLIDSKALAFSHRVFGRYHHTVPLFVRKISDKDVADIRTDLRNAIQGFPTKDFVCLYPSESTIPYLVRRLVDILPTKRCHSVVPAFRAFGQKRLIVDGKRENEHYDATTPVLFLDDSLSSGATEAQAREAWRNEVHATTLPTWTSYVLLRRGQLDEKLSKSNIEYCAIGPKAYSAGDCPLCRALRRLKRARLLLEPLQSESAALLESVERLCEPLALEAPAETFLLGPTDTADFVSLSGAPLWNTALQLVTPGFEVSSGAAIFAALHAPDLSAQLDSEQIPTLIKRFSESVDSNTPDKARHLVTAAAMLPLGILRPTVQLLVESLLPRSARAVFSSVAAVLLAAEDDVLQQHRLAGMTTADIAQRYGTELSKIQKAVTRVGLQGTSETNAAAQAVQLELRAMTSPTGTPNLVQLARNLSAIFSEGLHDTLLIPQINAVDAQTLVRTSEQLLNAIDRLVEFATLINNFAAGKLINSKLQIELARSSTDCELFRKVAYEILESWQQLKETYFHTPRQLASAARAGLDSTLYEHRDVPEASLWFEVEQFPSEITEWRVLGPSAFHLKGHFENLFTNTIKHAHQPYTVARLRELTANATTGGVLGRIRWEPDRLGLRLALNYVQSFPSIGGNTSMGSGLMAETTALLAMFGGALAPGLTAMPAFMQAEQAELTDFSDVCITSFAVVWEKSR